MIQIFSFDVPKRASLGPPQIIARHALPHPFPVMRQAGIADGKKFAYPGAVWPRLLARAGRAGDRAAPPNMRPMKLPAPLLALSPRIGGKDRTQFPSCRAECRYGHVVRTSKKPDDGNVRFIPGGSKRSGPGTQKDD